MRPRFLLAAVALFGALAGSGVAAAQSIAYAIPYGTTNMRAGPGVDYPVVAIIRGGSAVTVYGCLSDFSWCDSIVQDIRGWVSTTRLQFEYGGNLVPIPRYYSYFDAPIIGFDFGYWDRYYTDRPFYRDRHHHRGRGDDRPRDRDDQRPGIFPEEGGPPRHDGGGRRDYWPPGSIDQGGNGTFPEEGGGRNRNRPPASNNQGGNGVFPEEGGNAGPPAISDDSSTGGQGSAGAPCPPGNPSCQ
jgi:uncharacterized protein YraI